MKEVVNNISGREFRVFLQDRAKHLLLQPVDEHSATKLPQEVELIRKQVHQPFTLAAFMIADWNRDLTPWTAPPAFGNTPFGDGANDTLAFIASELLPHLQSIGIDAPHKVLGGYSLAGLFALWASYQTDVFDSVVAASPSVWYPNWVNYATRSTTLATDVYLSLGDKEAKTKNQLMSQVDTSIIKQHDSLISQGVNTTLQWNQGNHFMDVEKRMAKGLAWAINNSSQ